MDLGESVGHTGLASLPLFRGELLEGQRESETCPRLHAKTLGERHLTLHHAHVLPLM